MAFFVYVFSLEIAISLEQNAQQGSHTFIILALTTSLAGELLALVSLCFQMGSLSVTHPVFIRLNGLYKTSSKSLFSRTSTKTEPKEDFLKKETINLDFSKPLDSYYSNTLTRRWKRKGRL